MLELRPYQQECLRSILTGYKAGRRRVLVSLPTGTGKTVVFAAFPRFFRMKKRLLVLAHREELLEQAHRKFQLANPELRVEIEQAARYASDDAQVVIASVPTLGRTASQRLARLRREDFFLVVVDEAHHAVADTYVRIFDHFGLREPDTPRMLVGFTATPHRGDGAGLGAVFEDIVFRRDLRSMIRERFLCRIRGWRIVTDVDLDAVKVRHGDFVESQLAAAVNTEVRNEAVVKAYRDFAPGRRAVIFCADVAHARAMAAAFLDAGVAAAGRRGSSRWGSDGNAVQEEVCASSSKRDDGGRTQYHRPMGRASWIACALVLMLVGCGRSGIGLPDARPDAVERCTGVDGTFATRVLAYDPAHGGGSTPETPSYADPDAALGIPDYVHAAAEGAVALGDGGLLELAFEGCRLAPSGDGEPDLRVYEVGPAVEGTTVALRLTTPAALAWGQALGGDSEGWVDVGIIAGSALDVDVDERLGPLDPDEVRFDALRLVDDATTVGTGGSSPGADIDAVELLVFDAP